jgi:hypothetical protein
MDWKEYLGIGISLAIVLIPNFVCLYVLKNVECAIGLLAMLAAYALADSVRNHGIIRRLNDRISNLEDQMEKGK